MPGMDKINPQILTIPQFHQSTVQGSFYPCKLKSRLLLVQFIRFIGGEYFFQLRANVI